jgi:hypothetical protein
MKKKYLWVLVLLILATLACSTANTMVYAYEDPGQITIVRPEDNDLSNDSALSANGIDYLPVEIAVESTFKDTKVASVLLNGEQLLNYSCPIMPNTVSTCKIPLMEKGTYDFAVQVTRDGGEVVSTQTVSYTWQPYTTLDLAAKKWSGGTSVAAGYGLMAGAAVIVLTLMVLLLAGLMFRNSNDLVKILQIAATWGFAVSAFVVGMFLATSDNTAESAYVFVGLFFIAALVIGTQFLKGRKDATWFTVDADSSGRRREARMTVSVNDGSNELPLAAANAIEAVSDIFHRNPGHGDVIITKGMLDKGIKELSSGK